MAAPEGTHVSLPKELKTLLKQYSNLEMMDGKQRVWYLTCHFIGM
jgi:hypothetical protein